MYFIFQILQINWLDIKSFKKMYLFFYQLHYVPQLQRP